MNPCLLELYFYIFVCFLCKFDFIDQDWWTFVDMKESLVNWHSLPVHQTYVIFTPYPSQTVFELSIHSKTLGK